MLSLLLLCPLREHSIEIVSELHFFGLLCQLVFLGKFFHLEILGGVRECLNVQSVRVGVINFVLTQIMLFKLHILCRTFHLGTLTIVLGDSLHNALVF